MSVASPQAELASSQASVSTVRSALWIQCFAPSRSVDFDWSENHLSAMAEIVSKVPARNARKFFPFQAYSEPIVSTHEERASHGGFSLPARGAFAGPDPSGSFSRAVNSPAGPSSHRRGCGFSG